MISFADAYRHVAALPAADVFALAATTPPMGTDASALAAAARRRVHALHVAWCGSTPAQPPQRPPRGLMERLRNLFHL